MPRVHYKGRQGDYYVMVSKEECVKSLTLQLVAFLCCRLQCTGFYLSVGIGFFNSYRSWICLDQVFGTSGTHLGKRKDLMMVN